MKQIQTNALLLTVASLVLCACPTTDPKPGSGVTIPASDPTPPTVAMDILFPQDRTYYVTPEGYNPTMPTDLSPKAKIPLYAKGTDLDGGVSGVGIFIEKTFSYHPTSPDGEGGSPGLYDGKPTAASIDSAKQPGDKAHSARTTSYVIDVSKDRTPKVSTIRYRIRAIATNFHGGVAETRRIELHSR